MALKERITLAPAELARIEERISIDAHVRRYGMVRPWLTGHVLDCACGCGYGTWMIGRNPLVTSVVGVDWDHGAIAFAKAHYGTDKTSFMQKSIDKLSAWDLPYYPIDTLVSIETIEHLPNPKVLALMADRLDCEQIIVSYPTKPSTAYNPFHYHDLNGSDVSHIFEKYELSKGCIQVDGEYEIKFLGRRS
ncbi:MAG TPA: class I SAM-dependent methyltransferase [Phycisphaerae bacterium]|nr:class I SAM-dependent methyltransferase [Phycisphaerae bacterium]